MQRLSILHISDLHRGPSSLVTNNALLNSLESDLARYSAEGPITKPNLIVVSGDLVRGVQEKEPIKLMRQQYDEAADFLTRLAVSV